MRPPVTLYLSSDLPAQVPLQPGSMQRLWMSTSPSNGLLSARSWFLNDKPLPQRLPAPAPLPRNHAPFFCSSAAMLVTFSNSCANDSAPSVPSTTVNVVFALLLFPSSVTSTRYSPSSRRFFSPSITGNTPTPSPSSAKVCV